MNQDLSSVRFNPDARRQSAAREAAIGLRYLIASIAMSALGLLLTVVAAMAAPDGMGLLSLLALALVFVAFACGAYAIYSMMDALGWSGAVTGVLILSTLIPYAKFVVLIVVGAKALDLVGNAGFRFSLFGKLQLKKAVPPPLPETGS